MCCMHTLIQKKKNDISHILEVYVTFQLWKPASHNPSLSCMAPQIKTAVIQIFDIQMVRKFQGRLKKCVIVQSKTLPHWFYVFNSCIHFETTASAKQWVDLSTVVMIEMVWSTTLSFYEFIKIQSNCKPQQWRSAEFNLHILHVASKLLRKQAWNVSKLLKLFFHMII